MQFFFSLLVCLCTCSLIWIFNSGYEHAVLLAMSWLVFSKPENTSEWNVAQQPDPSRVQMLSLIKCGVLLFLTGKSKAKGITVTGSQGRHYCSGPRSSVAQGSPPGGLLRGPGRSKTANGAQLESGSYSRSRPRNGRCRDPAGRTLFPKTQVRAGEEKGSSQPWQSVIWWPEMPGPWMAPSEVLRVLRF